MVSRGEEVADGCGGFGASLCGFLVFLAAYVMLALCPVIVRVASAWFHQYTRRILVSEHVHEVGRLA